MQKLLLFLLLVSCSVSYAQQKAGNKAPAAMNWKDISSWRSVSSFNVTLSNDGKWVAYPLTTREGDGELMVKKVNDTLLKKYPVGGSSFVNFSFSEDGKWIAFKEASKYSDIQAAAKTPGKQLFDKLILVDLASGKQTTVERAGGFSFNGKNATHLAVSIVKERGASKPDDASGTDLLIIELASGKIQNVGNVGEFSFNKVGNYLAYSVDAANKSGNGLYVRDVAAQQIMVLDNDKAVYKSIAWNEEGTAFALLKLITDEKYKTEKGIVLGVKNIGKSSTITTYDPAKDSVNFPAGQTISKNRRPFWSDDLSKLFFGIAALEPVKKDDKPSADSAKKSAPVVKLTDAEKLENIKKDTAIKTINDLKNALAKLDTAKAKPAVAKNNATKPDMIIWHWQDKRLQSRQQVTEMADKNFTYIGMYDANTAAFKQLNDSSSRSLSILPKQKFALVIDDRDYELDINLDGQSYGDVYVVDLKDGSKTLLEKKFYMPAFTSRPQASPDGTKFVYGKNGHFYVYDLVAKTNTNVTEKIPTSFVNTDDDHNVALPLTPVVGWSSDNKYVLIRDLWDIWQIAANNKTAAVNITKTGAATKTRHVGRYIIDQEEKGIDLQKPVYVSLYGEWNKKSGIGRIEPGKAGLQPGVKQLVWDDARVSALAKAKNAAVYMYSKEKSNVPTEFYTTNEQLTTADQVTSNAPDRAKYTWSAGSQLVDYVSDKGDTLQGALFLPAGYEKGKKYPTIVYYYEKTSQGLNSYVNPDYPGNGFNPNMYTSNGYVVFMPDIVYKMDDPGMSAVWCVLPAVKAALKTGIIDENRMGLQGHSWGGYQTAFLVTQTNMFKAAAPGAALTNMVSMYDLIYWNSGGGNMSIFEASQGRFKGAPWENWDSYLRNSPIYHIKKVATPILLLHNDKDGAVDFTQGIEFYNALRRLKKPVVMITYKGENHGIAKLENRKDYAVRMMEFFDHHLKGKAAPDWLKDGIDKSKLDDHLEKRAF